MEANTEQLTKLAQELIERVDSLEQENKTLKEQLNSQVKQASAKAEAAPVVVPDYMIDATIAKLVKVGSLTEDQIPQSKEVFHNDLTAPHRLLQHFLDAQLQAKTAAAEADGNITGGTLVSNQEGKADPRRECQKRMAAILGTD